MNEPPGTNGECSTARRADRLETFPAALAIAGDDLGAPTFLRLVERWRTANALVTASMDELVASPGGQARQAGNASPTGSPRRWHRTFLAATSSPL